MTLHGNRELYIENYSKILDFGAGIMKIKGEQEMIEISGCGFVIEYMSKDEIKVCGIIENIKHTEAPA